MYGSMEVRSDENLTTRQRKADNNYNHYNYYNNYNNYNN
jgi:hypothetical protein